MTRRCVFWTTDIVDPYLRNTFLFCRYQLLCGVTEYETYHDFGAIALEHGILETQRDDFITKFAKLTFEGAEEIALKEILKQ